MNIDELYEIIKNPEDRNLELKSAKNSFSVTKDLPDYCAALSNEGGGKLILGVNEVGKIVGTRAFENTLNTLPHEMLNKIKIRVDIEEITTQEGRVLVFHIPPRLKGQITKSTGDYKYPVRSGESLVEMDTSTIKRILQEQEDDFSSMIVKGLEISNLVPEALIKLKQLWAGKAQRNDFLKISDRQMLSNLGLLTQNGLNYTALILLGDKESLEKYIPDSEIIFEWRQEPNKISHDHRSIWRAAFILSYDEIWKDIDSRNSRMPYQEGFIQREIFAFEEKSIREALMNAVAHRDYAIKGRSIFIKASPELFKIESPGSLPVGITVDNILTNSAWRNRKLAETLEKAGLVERSGQGLNDIFYQTIKDGKGLPDLSETTDYEVVLKIPAKVTDKQFVSFLEEIANKQQKTFSLEEIYELEKIRIGEGKSDLKYKKKFLDMGVVERTGSGKGTRYILSHKYYAHEGQVGLHTRLLGLSRAQKKELIISHLRKNGRGYMKDFKDAFPELDRMAISNILRELRTEEKTEYIGRTSKGYWQLK